MGMAQKVSQQPCIAMEVRSMRWGGVSHLVSKKTAVLFHSPGKHSSLRMFYKLWNFVSLYLGDGKVSEFRVD
jgi:hypothetical protein